MIGFCAHLTVFLGVLAAGQTRAGQPVAALATINDALEWTQSHEQRWYCSELLRIKAEIILLESSATADAEALLRQALDLAEHQGALPWALRAATSLARLLRQQGQADQARFILEPIYRRFGEGFAASDLISARELLDSL
jgi:predicted ATPase